LVAASTALTETIALENAALTGPGTDPVIIRTEWSGAGSNTANTLAGTNSHCQ
jgi:hypothetical protein